MMMILAGVLVVVALVIGYLGISIGMRNSEPVAVEPEPVDIDTSTPTDDALVPEEQVEPANDVEGVDVDDIALRQPVVVVAQNLPAYHFIRQEDLQIEQLRLMPPGSFSDPSILIGRRVWRELPAGSVLTENSFTAGGPIARMIRPDERALAIQFDQLMGAGGHLAPGDYVDVLLFLPEDEINTDRTVQVAVPALRVLSIGSQLGLDISGSPVNPPAAPEDTSNTPNQTNAATAVLAVPEVLLTRFALAAEAGRLRLAVRAAEEHRLENYYGNAGSITDELNQQLFQFEKFALSQAPRPQSGLVESSSRRQAQPQTQTQTQTFYPEQPSMQQSGPPAGSVPVIRGAVISLEAP